MRILVVEDDMVIANLLQRALREESYAVDLAHDGIEGEWLATENPYDLVILDVMLPRKDGISALQSMRAAGVKSPVLMLTARDEVKDKITGLDGGADDYMTKPFSLDELLARCRSLMRRRTTDYAGAVIEVGHLKIDPARKEVSRAGQVIELTSKEYALIEYLGRNAGKVVSRSELSEHVWEMDFEPSSNVVDVYVGYLRSKIDKGFDNPMLKTVRGHGYMLEQPT
jgi:DNA-binding response OmpR family regulator